MPEVLEETKVCTRCGDPKALEEFYFLIWADRYGSECIVCKNANRRKRRKARKEKDPIGHEEKMKNAALKKHYGITLEFYEKLYEKQEGKCAICGVKETILNRKLAVDHDHDTGKIRGLLCTNCNSILGYADDNIIILEKVIKYLGSC